MNRGTWWAWGRKELDTAISDRTLFLSLNSQAATFQALTSTDKLQVFFKMEVQYLYIFLTI